MTPDHRLIANAQSLAGAHVHDVANRVTTYENACRLLDTRLTFAERPRVRLIAVESERWLRQFVAKAREEASR